MERTLAFRIDEDFHRELKVKLAERGITLKSYVIGLIERDLRTPQGTPIDTNALRSAVEKIQEGAEEILALLET